MEVRYQLTSDEYLKAAREYCTRIQSSKLKSRMKQAAIVALLLAGLIGVILTDAGLPIVWLLLAVCFYVILKQVVWWPSRLRRIFRESSNLHLEQHLAINEDSIVAENSVAKDLLRWQAFQNAHESKDAFFLILSPLSFILVPKRAFVDGDLEAFRQLLYAKGLLTK